jgi:hypothetical protein
LDPAAYRPQVRFIAPGDVAGRGVPVEAAPRGAAIEAVLADTGVSGIYEVGLQARDGPAERRVYAYNVDPREGDLRIVAPSQLATQLRGVPHSVHDAAELGADGEALAGFNLSGLLLAGLLLLLAAEQLVAYLASYHHVSQGRPG